MRRYMGYDIPEVEDIQEPSRFRYKGSPYVFCTEDPNRARAFICTVSDIQKMNDSEANKYMFEKAVDVINRSTAREEQDEQC